MTGNGEVSSPSYVRGGGVLGTTAEARTTNPLDQKASAPPENSFCSWQIDVLAPAVSIEGSLKIALDGFAERFVRGNATLAMRELCDWLLAVRGSVHPDQWKTLVKDGVTAHPIKHLILQCPLTRRSFEKPRGYSGDAVLLDMIYGVGSALQTPHPVTIAGQVHFYVVHSSACRAVRRRREIVAAEIAKTVLAKGGDASVLSVACGHLRELDLLGPEIRRGIGAFNAVDQDAQSLAEVADCYGSLLNLNLVEGSVRSILSKRTVFEGVDLVYASGLFDYLAPPVAIRLIERMFAFLNPGGRLIVANFTSAFDDLGYMESFMDWWLIYRTAHELEALFDLLPPDLIESLRLDHDEHGIIAYATLEKRR